MPHLPSQFLNAISDSPGLDMPAFVKIHEEEEKITSVRFNPFKKCVPDFLCDNPVPWAQNAYYLRDRPSFTLDPLFHAGCYYVQEAGSMFLEHAVRSVFDSSLPFNIIDVCAAPGGKSTLLNSLLTKDGLLVSNEIIKSRSLILAEQLAKWGQSNTIVLNMEPAKLKSVIPDFDLVVIDAPCSGSGLFRKQPEALLEWSPDAVKACSIRQQSILNDLVPEMKPGAYLFYSTCSYSREENEDIVAWLQAQYDLTFVKIALQADWGITETEGGYRFYPDQTKTEGFFCALLQKRRDEHVSKNSRKEPGNELHAEELKVLQEYLAIEREAVVKKNGFFYMMPRQVRHFLNQHEGKLYVRKAGVCLGEIKGRDLVPSHELALSSDLQWQGGRIEVDKQEALQFLRKEVMPARAPQKGFVKVLYEGQGLGWVKVLGNRINNYLPNEFRILKQDEKKK